jgi:hypothetical protein
MESVTSTHGWGHNTSRSTGFRAQGNVRAHAAHGEADKWRTFLVQVLADKTTQVQAQALRRGWNDLATEAQLLNLRFPTAEASEDGYAFTWRYRDTTGMLVLDVEPDGLATWFIQEADFEPIRSLSWTPGTALPLEVVLAAQRFRT